MHTSQEQCAVLDTKGSSSWGLRGQKSQIPESSPTPVLQGPQAPCYGVRSTCLGWDSPSCRVPRHTVPSGRGAGPWHPLPPARQAHLATLRLSWGCSLAAISGSTWLRRRWSSTPSSCSSSTFLSVTGPGAVVTFSCGVQGSPESSHSPMCKASTSKMIPQTHGVTEGLLVLLAPP